MTTCENDPAFPVRPGTPLNDTGLSKREYLAAQALVGLLANPGGSGLPVTVARRCFEIADAMIEESNREVEP